MNRITWRRIYHEIILLLPATHGALVTLSFQFSGLFVATQENSNFWLGGAYILRPAIGLAWTASRFLYAHTDNQKLHGSQCKGHCLNSLNSISHVGIAKASMCLIRNVLSLIALRSCYSSLISKSTSNDLDSSNQTTQPFGRPTH